jgi:hypothetical protein
MGESEQVNGEFAVESARSEGAAGGACCGGAASKSVELVVASPCCGTSAQAEAESACCGASAKSEAVAIGANCCG